jgi:hypothetical protein
MKLFTGWVISAGLVLSATTANAQILQAPIEIANSLVTTVSDVVGPYAAMPPEALAPAPGYGPMLMPPQEVYTVVRESGFSPLGIPRQRGLFYTIAVIDRGGEDGRLVIDARTGRIVRFTPAYGRGDNFNEDDAYGPDNRYGPAVVYGPAGPLPPMNPVRGAPRPPASVPHVASRTPSVPMPKAPPLRKDDTKPLAAQPAPEPVQQSAAAPTPAPAPAPAQQSASIEAKPAAPVIKPTQEMPKAQGLE